MSPKATVSLIVMLSLTLAACDSSMPQAPNVSLSTITPAAVPSVLPTPSSIVAFDKRLFATVDINYPDEIVYVHGSIWVKTDDGHVVQVDPATNTVVGGIKVDTTNDPNHYCQGFGTDGENIWACSASSDEDNKTIDVVRIDPDSKSVVETLKVGKVFDQLDMPFLLNQIWVLSDDGNKLLGIDVKTNQAGPAIDLGTRCFQLAVLDKSLLATCALDNLLLRIDPEKKEVTSRVKLQSPHFIATTKNGVWVAQEDAVTRLDPKSLKPVITFTGMPDVGTSGDIFATDEAVWVRQESGFLYRIDPSSNEIVEQIGADQSLSGGSLLVTPDSIWTTASDDNLLLRLSLE